ncbi:flagellar hook-associated protein 1 FlgK [Clostridium moniliforme]|uniref:Flagellar hook-associated protein 1 n=1 Tax=Clostridium moniliforme TaxID=39489 RepID=A0ABS4F1B1_9CLOT|nr:flagellar hook-associated protein FlgK [Clostridium moniliforme]MBP1890040.1 flagellar hook-associated protein 1 FlgK [Clostridium moniliforme]
MTGLLGTLQTAKSGMIASKTAIQTTSHNISNLNTPGYTRQRVEQTTSRPYTSIGYNSHHGPGQLGTGVTVNDVTRIRNSFYDFQFRSESHKYGEVNIKSDYYRNMENIFDEPSKNSISASINDFFNSLNELSKDPNSVGAKNVAIEKAKFLSNNINSVNSKLETLNEQLNSQTESIVSDINNKILQIKELDKNIKLIQGANKSPNDLLDQRDNLMDELSFKIDVNDDSVKAVFDVEGKDAKVQANDLEVLKSKIKEKSLSGELSGTKAMKAEIEKYQNKLRTLSNAITANINNVYKGKENIFVAGKNGKLIDVNPNIIKDVSKLEMTSSKALELYDIQNKKVNIDGEDITVGNYYNGTIQELGQSSQIAKKQEFNNSKLLHSIDKSRMSISGVSMDEEIVNLVQLQHAYNASAKVISTIDSLLNVVVNGLIK